MEHREHKDSGQKKAFFFVISVIFVVNYFPRFSRIERISRLIILSKPLPFKLLHLCNADYKNSLK
jgi:hypothetical protein